jgi:hypothetical protein
LRAPALNRDTGEMPQLSRAEHSSGMRSTAGGSRQGGLRPVLVLVALALVFVWVFLSFDLSMSSAASASSQVQPRAASVASGAQTISSTPTKAAQQTPAKAVPQVAAPLSSAKAAPQAKTQVLAAKPAGVQLYVDPRGSDKNTGAGQTTPLKTIQAALNRALPGTTIHLAAGTYHEEPTTVRNGTAAAPIKIQGPESGKAISGRYKAVLYGTGRVFNINNSHYVLDGFTIDGQEALKGQTYPTQLGAVRAFKDRVQGRAKDGRLIYIGSASSAHNVTGVDIRNMFLSGAGGECVRLRNDADYNTIENSVIQWCGMYGAGDDKSTYRYHNGEGVYIGTSPKSTDQPMYPNDDSSHNVIRDNLIVTNGSECLDVKENAHDNTFTGNDCRNNDEPLSFGGSNIELRGYRNSITYNTLTGSRGSAVKLKSDSARYAIGGNIVRDNKFSGGVGPTIVNGQAESGSLLCGNKANAKAATISSGSRAAAASTACS